MNALRGKLARLVPCYEHDEGVASHRCQSAIRLSLAIDAAEDVRTAIDGEVERAAAQPVHLAPLRIDPPEVRLQRRDGFPQRVGRRLGSLVFQPRADQRFDGQDGERRGAIGHIRLGIPVPQNVVRLREAGIFAGIDRQDLGKDACFVRPRAVFEIVFIGVEGVRRDVQIRAESLYCAPAAVGHVGLNSEGRREVFRFQIACRRGGVEGSVVGIEDQAGRRIPDLRFLVERQIAPPDQVGTIARQHALPIHALPPHRERSVIDVPDVAALVGVYIVEARDRLQPHRRAPFFETDSFVQAEILERRAHFVHAGIADGEHPMIGLHYRPLLRIQDVAMRGPDDRPPDLHADAGDALLEIVPLSIQPILIGICRIDGQLIDVHEVGAVDRVRPAEMPIVPMQHEWRPGKEAAGHVPSFAAVEHGLVPGDWAGIRLVRIDQQAGGSVGRS